MILAAYDESGTLVYVRAETAPPLNNLDEYEITYDMTDMGYAELKAFMWDSLHQITPLCDAAHLIEK